MRTADQIKRKLHELSARKQAIEAAIAEKAAGSASRLQEDSASGTENGTWEGSGSRTEGGTRGGSGNSTEDGTREGSTDAAIAGPADPGLTAQLERLEEQILLLEWVLNEPVGKYHA